jgi:PAS domain S-box-containing protein
VYGSGEVGVNDIPKDPVFRSIAESSPDSIMLLDRDQNIEFINKTAPGLTIDQVIGTPIYQYLSEGQHASHRACFQRVAETGEPGFVESIYPLPDGTVSLWESRVGPVKRDGKVTGFVMLASNVTEARSATVDRERFFELSLDMMCVAGLDGYFKLINEAFTRVLGYTKEKLLAEPLLYFVHPDDRPKTERARRVLSEGGDVVNFENRYRRSDGAYVTLQWKATLDADTHRIHAVARDVTEQRVLQAKLLQSQKMDAIGQLAGGVAHDFNNLMLAILANTTFAMEAAEKDPEMLEFLEEIQQAGKRSADLTQQLLAVSRRRPLHPKNVVLNDVVRTMLKMLKRLLPENIVIDFVAGHELGHIQGDTGQLEQVILNLCLNARDAMKAGGRLTMETEDVLVDGRYRESHPWAKPGRYVLLTVSDTGEGMSLEVQGRVFEPFFTTKPPGEGTGLGLATVYGIVDQHRGMVHVYSEEGHGSAFKVYLPISERLASEVGSAVEHKASGGKETVLVAEDEELVRKVVTKILSRRGYDVISAPDGESALALFKERQDDVAVVILDIVMPGMGGPEVYEKMEEIRPRLPVLFSSGYSDAARFSEVLPTGATLLDKPYEEQDLLARLREALDR